MFLSVAADTVTENLPQSADRLLSVWSLARGKLEFRGLGFTARIFSGHRAFGVRKNFSSVVGALETFLFVIRRHDHLGLFSCRHTFSCPWLSGCHVWQSKGRNVTGCIDASRQRRSNSDYRWYYFFRADIFLVESFSSFCVVKPAPEDVNDLRWDGQCNENRWALFDSLCFDTVYFQWCL